MSSIGYKQSEEHKAKRIASFKKSVKGRMFNNALDEWRKSGGKTWNKGLTGYNAYPRDAEWKSNISKGQKGKPKLNRRGENHHNWKGGISFKQRDLRNLKYIEWRETVFQRDNYTCQMPNCNKRGHDLESHHIIPWSKNENIRFDVNNGITLCQDCHNITKGNEDQYAEIFLNILTMLSTFTRS